MIRGVGPYSMLITPIAGSLFHAVFQPGASGFVHCQQHDDRDRSTENQRVAR